MCCSHPAGSQPPSGMHMQTHQGQGPGDQSWQMQHAGFSNNSAANLAGQVPTGKRKCFTIGINCEPCVRPAVCTRSGLSTRKHRSFSERYLHAKVLRQHADAESCTCLLASAWVVPSSISWCSGLFILYLYSEGT